MIILLVSLSFSLYPNVNCDVSMNIPIGYIERIDISTIPENNAFKKTITSDENISNLVNYINKMYVSMDFTENPEEYAGMTIILTFYFTDKDEMTVCLFGNMFMKVNNEAWVRINDKEATELQKMLMK